jgi:hypothetical protein
MADADAAETPIRSAMADVDTGSPLPRDSDQTAFA